MTSFLFVLAPLRYIPAYPQFPTTYMDQTLGMYLMQISDAGCKMYIKIMKQ